jgi:hypothetical protein
MTTTGKSECDARYLVGVNPNAAFTVFYEDGCGRLIFAIEVDDNPKKIYLNPRPTENGQIVDVQSEPAKRRVSLALIRVRAYFEGQGLSVDLD